MHIVLFIEVDTCLSAPGVTKNSEVVCFIEEEAILLWTISKMVMAGLMT